MSVGRTNSKTELDSALGAITSSLFATMDNVAKVKSSVDAITDTALQAAPFGYTAGEVAQIRSMLTDLDKLRTVFVGTATQATTYDFRTFSKLALGNGLY
jgi:hypothetical protein